MAAPVPAELAIPVTPSVLTHSPRVLCLTLYALPPNPCLHPVWLGAYSVQCVDYSNQPLPSGYDLVFSRDSLQHLPMHGAWQFLNNVKASGAKYLLVGSYIKGKHPNFNIQNVVSGRVTGCSCSRLGMWVG